jgi:hypothetical protein
MRTVCMSTATNRIVLLENQYLITHATEASGCCQASYAAK